MAEAAKGGLSAAALADRSAETFKSFPASGSLSGLLTALRRRIRVSVRQTGIKAIALPLRVRKSSLTDLPGYWPAPLMPSISCPGQTALAIRRGQAGHATQRSAALPFQRPSCGQLGHGATRKPAERDI